jgi:hypothetical protein
MEKSILEEFVERSESYQIVERKEYTPFNYPYCTTVKDKNGKTRGQRNDHKSA